MADIASLGLSVESRSVVKGATDLDRLTGAAKRAETAAHGVAGAYTDANGRLRDANGRFLGVAGAANRAAAANDNATRSFGAMGRALNSLKGQIAAYGAALAAALSIQGLIRAADNATQFANALRVAGVQGEAFNQVQERLYAAANRNGVQISALGSLYSRASIAAGELGASQGQLLKFTDGVTAALRVQGGSTAAASGALLQLSQALGAGIVRAEEFNSILEGAFPIAQAAARGLTAAGGSVARLRSLIVEGKVTSQEFFAALLKGFPETERQAESAALTIGQSFTVLGNSFTRFIGAFDEATGTSGALARAIQSLGLGLDALAQNMDTVLKVAQVVGPAMLVAFGPALLNAIRAVTGAVLGLTAAIATNPLGFLAVAITAAISALWAFRDEFSEIFGVNITGFVEGAANKIIGGMVGAYEAVMATWRQLPEAIGDLAIQAANAVISAVEGMVQSTLFALNGLIAKINDGLGFGLGTGLPFLPSPGSIRFGGVENPYSGAAAGVAGTAREAYLGAQGDYINGAEPGATPAVPGSPTTMSTPGLSSAEQKKLEKLAKAYDKLVTGAKDFIAAQQLERDALGLTEERANALRYQMELLNKARDAGIQLGARQVADLTTLANGMAAAEAATDAARDALDRAQDGIDDAKDATRGFIGDLVSGLREGKKLVDVLADAFTNLFNKITDRVLDNFVDALFGGPNAAKGQGAGPLSFLGRLFERPATSVPSVGGGAVTAAGGVSPVLSTPAAPPPVPGGVGTYTAAVKASGPIASGNNLVTGIRSAASQLGISPSDLATVISYETGGTFDPLKKGPTTQWGQHKGLIQWGQPQAQKYLGGDFSVDSQMNGIVSYMRDAGVKPGMGMMDVYSAVNAGRVGRYGASDAGNGGAWGTVADKVNYQMSGHRDKALALMGSGSTSPAVAAVEMQAQQLNTTVAGVTESFAALDQPTTRVAQAFDVLAESSGGGAMPFAGGATPAASVPSIQASSAQISTATAGVAQAATTMQTGLGGAFQGLVQGVGSIGGGFLQGLGGVLQSIIGGIGGGGGGGGGGIGGILSGVLGFVGSIFGGFANGAAFRGGHVVAFANGGVVGGPTSFPMAGGKIGLMGEAGAEAIMPLSRGRGGRLGISAHGMAPTIIERERLVIINGGITRDANMQLFVDERASRIARKEGNQIRKEVPAISESTRNQTQRRGIQPAKGI